MRCPPIEIEVGSLVLEEKPFVSVKTLYERSLVIEFTDLFPIVVTRPIKSHNIKHMCASWKVLRGDLVEKSGSSVGFWQVTLYRIES